MSKSKACLASAALAAIVATPSFAMQLPADEAPAALNELDILSRSKDDPFPQRNQNIARKPVSVTLRALDKITARYIDIEALMDEVAHFGSLEILPRYCDKKPPEEFPETTAFLQIFDKELKPASSDEGLDEETATDGEVDRAEEIARAQLAEEAALARAQFIDELEVDASAYDLDVELEGENIFNGWMFASSPALNSLEHAVYDVWVIDCKTEIADIE